MGYLRSRELLTTEQRKEFTKIAQDLDEWELAANFSLSNDDIELINSHRRDYNRLGFAMQLCYLRYTGWTLTATDLVPVSILQFISAQINVNYNLFFQYFQREATIFEHIEEIRKIFGYRSFSDENYQEILNFVLKHAMENGNAMHLIRLAIEELRKNKVILPAISTIERAVWEARQNAENKIYKLVNSCLSQSQKQALDKLLDTIVEKGKTKFA